MTDMENTVYEIMVYINLNLFEHITLDILSDRYAYSKYYIHRKFKEIAGLTLNDYVKKRRIEHSLYFLFTNSGASISEVAGYCGFSSAVYSREFRKVFHRSPRQWRNIYKMDDNNSRESKICKNYEQFIDYTDNGIPNEVKSLGLVREEPKRIAAAILFGNYTQTFRDTGNRLEACNRDNKPYIGIQINSPAVTDLSNCLFAIGIESGSRISGLSDIFMEGGDYIRVGFSGPREKLKEAMTWVFKYYFPPRNLKHDYRVPFIRYSGFPDFTSNGLACEILIPIAYN